MDLDEALEIVNDLGTVAYGDSLHDRIFRRYGEYEIGICPEYDRIVLAYALVAVELAMDTGVLQYLPPSN
jgi:hypothetical protein